MPTTAKTAAQTWIRAELVGVPDSAFGPQLLIPADGVEFHGPDLVFHRDGEVVYVTRPDQLRSLTWLGPATDPERERRRAQWPNHGKRWTGEQRESLRGLIVAGTGWTEIARTHGRSRTGVQQEAVKQGWVEADTLRPTPALIDEGGGGSAPDGADGDGESTRSRPDAVSLSPREHESTVSTASTPGDGLPDDHRADVVTGSMAPDTGDTSDTAASSTDIGGESTQGTQSGYALRASGHGDARRSDPTDEPAPSGSSHRVRLRPLRHGPQAGAEVAEADPDTPQGSADPTHAARADVGGAPIDSGPGGVPAPPEIPRLASSAPFAISALPSQGLPESPPLPPFPARVLGSYAVALSPRAPAIFPDNGLAGPTGLTGLTGPTGPTGAGRMPGQGPGQGSGQGFGPGSSQKIPPRSHDRTPPAVPHPREPERPPSNHHPGHLPGDRALADGLRVGGPLTPARPPGT